MSFKVDNPMSEHISVADTYRDAYGKEQVIDAAIKARLLAIMETGDSENAPLPSVSVFLQGKEALIPLAGDGEFDWTLMYENGGQVHGSVTGGTPLLLPDALPLGYHELILTRAEQRWTCRVIVAPQRCYEPEALSQGKRWWGVNVQLYTLRSPENWGVGDFGDLRELVEQVARRGGALSVSIPCMPCTRPNRRLPVPTVPLRGIG